MASTNVIKPRIKPSYGTPLYQGVSKVLRWMRAIRTIVEHVPQHIRQKDTTLPSIPRRIWEQSRLLLSSGLTPTNYYRYRLHRKDLAWEQKAAFIGFFEGWRWQLAANPSLASVLVSDKIIFSKLLSASGVPEPSCIGVFGLPRGPLGLIRQECVKAELEAFLSEPKRENFFLKPVYGGGGAGHISVGRCIREGAEWELLPYKRSTSFSELVQLGPVEYQRALMIAAAA